MIRQHKYHKCWKENVANVLVDMHTYTVLSIVFTIYYVYGGLGIQRQNKYELRTTV